MLNYPCQVKEEVKRWIRDYFEKNGKGCFAVIGISVERTPAWRRPCVRRHLEKIGWWAY